MALPRRSRSGRFTKSNAPRRRTRRRNARRRARRNYYGAGVLANPPRRRRRRSNPRRHHMRRNARRRHYSRNPKMFGFELPDFKDVLFTGAGLIIPNQVAGYILGMIPDSIKKQADGTTSPVVAWAVKVASVLVPSMLVRKFVSPRAGNLVLVGGSAGLVLDAIKTYMPGVIPGLGYQPLLGEYQLGLGAYMDSPAPPMAMTAGRPGNMLPNILARTPERLDPSGRF